MSFNSNTTGVTSGAGNVDQFLVLCVVFCSSYCLFFFYLQFLIGGFKLSIFLVIVFFVFLRFTVSYYPLVATNLSYNVREKTQNKQAKLKEQCRSNPAQSIPNYVRKLVSDLRQVGGFLGVFRSPLPIKLTVTI